MPNLNTDTDTTTPPDSDPFPGRDPVPAAVDWAISGLTAASGILATVVGAWLFVFVDRDLIADVVTAESVEVNGITPSEAITAGVPFVEWVAVGIAVSGVLLIAGAAIFTLKRRATRRRVDAESGTTATFWACTVYGAAVTVLTSFVPFSSAIGGGAAAYLHADEDDSVRVGAASGALLSLLSVPLVVFLAVGLLAGADVIGQLAGGILLVGGMVFGTLVGVVLNAGLGALGGWAASRWA